MQQPCLCWRRCCLFGAPQLLVLLLIAHCGGGFHFPFGSTLHLHRRTTACELYVADQTADLGAIEPTRQQQQQLQSQSADSVFVLNGYAKQESVEGAEQASALLGQLERHSDVIPLTTKHYTIVIDAWGKAGDVDRAEQVFRRLQDQEGSLAPSRVTYNVLMHANIRAGRIQRAEDLLQEMERRQDDPLIQPLTMDYNVVLGYYARNGHYVQAERLLKRMVDRCGLLEGMHSTAAVAGADSSSCCCSCQPDLATYNLLLEAHARAGQSARAQSILVAMEAQYARGDLTFQPDGRTYNAVVQALLRDPAIINNTSDTTKPPPGEDYLTQRVQTIYEQATGRGALLPDVDLLRTTLLDMYVDGGQVMHATRAEQLLDEMEADGNASVVSYNKVLKAWKNIDSPDAASRALTLLERLEKRGIVDCISYTTVIGVLANNSRGNSTSAAERAAGILDKMLSSYERGDVRCKPNTQTLNSVLLAWVRAGDIPRAELVLRRMEQYHRDGEAGMAPSVVSYSIIMDAWAKSDHPDALALTEATFRDMMSLYEAGHTEAKPNRVSYVTMISAYAKSGGHQGAQQAENLLYQMYDAYREGDDDLKPNTQVITTVMDAWNKSGQSNAGERAEALLEWMIEKYISTQDADMCPNAYSFTTAIAAWGRARRIGKAQRARQILDRMLALHKSGAFQACPNTHCYTAVINACAYCENDDLDKRDALRIAVTTYKDLIQSSFGQPNHVTFVTLLTALRNLLPKGPERDAAVQIVFRNAARDGQVDPMVVRRVQSALSGDQLQQVLASAISTDGQVMWDHIPNEWRRNVPTQHGAAAAIAASSSYPQP